MMRSRPRGGKPAAPAVWLALIIAALALLVVLWNLLQ